MILQDHRNFFCITHPSSENYSIEESTITAPLVEVVTCKSIPAFLLQSISTT